MEQIIGLQLRFSSFATKMDSLIKAAENFEQTSTVENFDEKIFLQFMKKVVIWEFFGITKQAYLALSEQEKRDKISKYYSDMILKQSSSSGFQ